MKRSWVPEPPPAAIAPKASEPAKDPESELRPRLAKLLGMIGSDHGGERAAAIDAISRTLAGAGKRWSYVADLVAGDGGDREKLLGLLVKERLHRGLQRADTMLEGEAKFVREISARCGAKGLENTSASAIAKAIGIADAARRRAAPLT